MRTEPTLLIVDDDLGFRKFLRVSLNAHQYHQILEASHGQMALELAKEHSPDAVLLDIGLPDLSGLEVTRHLRSFSSAPILVLSVREDEEALVEAFDLGADDYLCKPFRMIELLARLRAALRRKHGPIREGLIKCGEILIDQDARVVSASGRPLNLTPIEYALLRKLAVHEGELVLHRVLLQDIWGADYPLDPQVLRVHVSNLRKKLERLPQLARYLQNEPGLGYRLVVPSAPELSN